jgi:hypothetical protein
MNPNMIYMLLCPDHQTLFSSIGQHPKTDLHNWRHVYRVSVVRRQSQILAILFWMEFAREFSTFSLFFLEWPFWWFFAHKNKIFVHHCGLANNFLKFPIVESIIISFPSPTILPHPHGYQLSGLFSTLFSLCENTTQWYLVW